MENLIKKLIRDYIYFSDTFEDIKEISESAEREFRDALMQEDPNALEALAPPEGAAPPKKKKEDETVIFDDKEFKKLFRKVAVKCHPDKFENSDISEREKSFLEGCYERLSEANDQYNWGLLLRVAYDLDVEVQELDQEKLDNINQNIEKLKTNISRYEESMAYQWYVMGNEETKQRYLQACADIFVKSLDNR